MGRCPCFGSRKKGKGKNDQEDEKNLKSVGSTVSVSGRSLGTFFRISLFIMFILFTTVSLFLICVNFF